MGKILSTPTLPEILRTVKVALSPLPFFLYYYSSELLYPFLVPFNNLIMHGNGITAFKFREVSFLKQRLLDRLYKIHNIMVFGFVKNGRNITNIFSNNDELINNICFFNRLMQAKPLKPMLKKQRHPRYPFTKTWLNVS